jgi:hypothetical protein
MQLTKMKGGTIQGSAMVHSAACRTFHSREREANQYDRPKTLQEIWVVQIGHQANAHSLVVLIIQLASGQPSNRLCGLEGLFGCLPAKWPCGASHSSKLAAGMRRLDAWPQVLNVAAGNWPTKQLAIQRGFLDTNYQGRAGA